MTDEQKNNEQETKTPAPEPKGDAPASPEVKDGEKAPTATEASETKPAAAPAPAATPAPAAGGGRGRGGFGGRGGGGRGGRGGPGGGRGGRRGGSRQGRGREKPEFESKTLDIARVSRVTKGGKRFSFRATVVIGDQKSKVGVGIGKGQDVVKSIQKAYAAARKEMMDVIIINGTIPYQVEAKFSSAQVLLKPSKGGIKAGGAVRVVAQLAGIHSLTGKNIARTNNKLNIARATIAALKKLRHTEASGKAAAAAAAVAAAKKAESDKKESEKEKDKGTKKA